MGDTGAPRSERLNLITKGPEEQQIMFNLKMSTKLTKLKARFAEKVGIPESSLNFFYNGHSVNDTDTPAELHMEDQDVIQVLREYDDETQ